MFEKTLTLEWDPVITVGPALVMLEYRQTILTQPRLWDWNCRRRVAARSLALAGGVSCVGAAAARLQLSVTMRGFTPRPRPGLRQPASAE